MDKIEEEIAVTDVLEQRRNPHPNLVQKRSKRKGELEDLLRKEETH